MPTAVIAASQASVLLLKHLEEGYLSIQGTGGRSW